MYECPQNKTRPKSQLSNVNKPLDKKCFKATEQLPLLYGPSSIDFCSYFFISNKKKNLLIVYVPDQIQP